MTMPAQGAARACDASLRSETNRYLRFCMLLVAAWVPLLAGRSAISAVVALQAAAGQANPYFLPAHALLLYGWTPLVIASTCIFLLSPGLLLALSLGLAQSTEEWILSSLALSLVVVSAAAGIVQSAAGTPLTGNAFVGVTVFCSLAGAAAVLLRARKGRLLWPFSEPLAGTTVFSAILAQCLSVALLLPKFFWEPLNGDGAHALETARLLLTHALPFWPEEAGAIASFPGVTSMLFAFPASWFMRLFGESEAVARLPLVLCLPALFAGILAIARHGGPDYAGRAGRWLIWLGLAVFVTVIGFSATYDPYAADLGMPAAQDALLMVCFLGYVYYFLRGRMLYAGAFAALTYISLPSGSTLILIWICAVALVWKPRPWARLAGSAGLLIVCSAAAAALLFLLARAHLPAPGNEYATRALLTRLNCIQWGDWHRIVFLVVPCGILPAFALFAWPRLDRVARALSLVALAYFSLFFVQAYVSLHHFIPAMLLPLPVFWRSGMLARANLRRWLLADVAVSGVAALAFSLPATARLNTGGKIIGDAIENRFPGQDYRNFKRIELFRYIVPYDWDASVPVATYGGSPLVWNYYSGHRHATSPAPNYILQSTGTAPPPAMRLLAQEEGAALYVRDESVLRMHRSLKPPSPAGSRLYALPRWMLFHGTPPPARSSVRVINVLDTLKGAGLNLDRLAGRKP